MKRRFSNRRYGRGFRRVARRVKSVFRHRVGIRL